MSADEVLELQKDGYLDDTMTSNLKEVMDSETLKSGKVNKFYY